MFQNLFNMLTTVKVPLYVVVETDGSLGQEALKEVLYGLVRDRLQRKLFLNSLSKDILTSLEPTFLRITTESQLASKDISDD